MAVKGSFAAESRRDEPSRDDLAGALHEVSNALTVVLGWLDAALPLLPHGSAREAVEVARAHSDLGYRLARQAIGGEVPSDLERSALAVARDAVTGVLQESKRAVVTVELVGPDVDGTVRDGATALQILVNLLLNAIAFSPSGGKVTLRVSQDGNRMAFEVSDQGPGIAPERADAILSGPSSTRRGGAGIGLVHSASLAQDRGGQLRLVQPGPGAVFELTWPIYQQRSATCVRQEMLASLSGVRVLVVEDDANVLSLVEMALETHGVQVLSVISPADLLEVLANGQTFDAALVDFSPFSDADADTDSALEALVRAVPGTGIVLISGLAREVPTVLEKKVAAWVRKPFEMTEVVDVLRRIVV